LADVQELLFVPISLYDLAFHTSSVQDIAGPRRKVATSACFRAREVEDKKGTVSKINYERRCPPFGHHIFHIFGNGDVFSIETEKAVADGYDNAAGLRFSFQDETTGRHIRNKPSGPEQHIFKHSEHDQADSFAVKLT